MEVVGNDEIELIVCRISSYVLIQDKYKPNDEDPMFYTTEKNANLEELRMEMNTKGCPGLELNMLKFIDGKEEIVEMKQEAIRLVKDTFKQENRIYQVKLRNPISAPPTILSSCLSSFKCLLCQFLFPLCLSS